MHLSSKSNQILFALDIILQSYDSINKQKKYILLVILDNWLSYYIHYKANF